MLVLVDMNTNENSYIVSILCMCVCPLLVDSKYRHGYAQIYSKNVIV